MVSTLAWFLLAGAVCNPAPAPIVLPVGGDQPLLQCDFSGASPGSNTPWVAAHRVDPNVDFHGWVHGSGSRAAEVINDGFGHFVTAETELSTLAESVRDNEYVSCSLSTRGDSRLDLGHTRVAFTVKRASWHAPRRYAVFTSATGFGLGDQLFSSTGVESSDMEPHEWSFFLPTDGLQSVDEIEFRIYAFDARHNTHETALTAFTLQQGVPTYSLELLSTEGGHAVASPEGELYESGDTIYLTATPEPGYRFAGWSGMVSGLGNPRPLTMNRDVAAVASFEPIPVIPMSIGTNLDAVVDWSTAWSHINLQKRARAWRTQAVSGDGPYSSGFGSEIPLDACGWPTEVPFTASDGSMQFVHAALRTANEAGQYIMSYRGSGELTLKFTGGSTQQLPTGGDRTYEFTLPDEGSIWYEIHSTSSEDPLRDISIVNATQTATVEAHPFHPLYVERLRPFSVLRFMDWGRTNGSNLSEWSARTRPDHYTEARAEGTSLEAIVLLANTTGRDAWICIPHAATNEYIRRAARLIRNTLNPSLRVWVEYSNETWNTSGPFTQTDYVQERGMELGLSTDPWEAGQRFVAVRSSQAWRIFEWEFGRAGVSRIVKVLATQSARPTLTRTRIAALSELHAYANFSYPDVLAIAPYFGGGIEPEEIPPHAANYPTVNEIVGVRSTESIEALREEIAVHKEIANEQGLKLVCYEGGQHFVGKRGAENDPVLTEILQDANRDPRMYTRYTEYLDMLQEEGVEFFCSYSFCREWSKWGSWGNLERMDQPLSEAPKYRALLDWSSGHDAGPE